MKKLLIIFQNKIYNNEMETWVNYLIIAVISLITFPLSMFFSLLIKWNWYNPKIKKILLIETSLEFESYKGIVPILNSIISNYINNSTYYEKSSIKKKISKEDFFSIPKISSRVNLENSFGFKHNYKDDFDGKIEVIALFEKIDRNLRIIILNANNQIPKRVNIIIPTWKNVIK